MLRVLGMMHCSLSTSAKQSISCFVFLQCAKELDPTCSICKNVSSPWGPISPWGYFHSLLETVQLDNFRFKWFLDILKPWEKNYSLDWNFGGNWNVCNFLSALSTSETILWTPEDNSGMYIIWFPHKVWYFWDWKLKIFLWEIWAFL